MEYPNYDDLSRLVYGRMFWKNPKMRERLVRHWTDPRHPHRERFLERRSDIERILTSEAAEPGLEGELLAEGSSLRAAVREIPPVFGSFWSASAPELPARAKASR